MTPDVEIRADVDVHKAKLSAAVTEPGVSAERICDLVCALVDSMKAAGSPPEKVVIAVKQAVLGDREVVADGAKRILHGTRRRQELLPQALTCCIQQYYREVG